MKKVSFLFIFFLIALINEAQKNEAITATDFKDEFGIIKREIDSFNKADSKNLTDSVSRIKELINGIKNKNEKFDWTSIIVAAVLTGISIVISVLVYRREGSYKHLDFLTNKNTMMLNEPQLWAMYDEYKTKYFSKLILKGDFTMDVVGQEELIFLSDGKISIGINPESGTNVIVTDSTNKITVIEKLMDCPGTKNTKYIISGTANVTIPLGISIEIKTQQDKELEGKIKAFCYYILNSFELVFKYNHSRSDIEAWENYMIDTLLKSSEYKGIAEEAVNTRIYGKRYHKKMEDFIAISSTMKELKKSGKKDEVLIKYKKAIRRGLKSCKLKKNSKAQEIEAYLDGR